MSSDLLLRGRGITKIYGSPLHPLAQLKAALLRRPPEGVVHKVLDNIDVDIYKGETVGIMGRNGAGKSTLLGILGNVIPPNRGTIERIGKIAVLLELGAGFNQNLTGIENVRIYCRMMGMPENVIDSKVEQIEDFAELGDYFRLPIRTYSSGMTSRLGFSSAVHVDADLVIVDETLSVGDASFKMKCYAQIDRMKKDGMTFLLVSHSQNLIANFCTRAIVIDGGKKRFEGKPLEAIGVYKQIRAESETQRKPKVITRNQNSNAKKHSNTVDKLTLIDFTYREEQRHERDIGVVGVTLEASETVLRPVFALGIRNSTGIAICSISTDDIENELPPLSVGDCLNIEVKFMNILSPGPYFVTSYASEYTVGDVKNIISLMENAIRFDVVKPKRGAGVVELDMELSWEESLAEKNLANQT